jgi:LPXTG-motif cell wall-anchored protein
MRRLAPFVAMVAAAALLLLPGAPLAAEADEAPAPATTPTQPVPPSTTVPAQADAQPALPASPEPAAQPQDPVSPEAPAAPVSTAPASPPAASPAPAPPSARRPVARAAAPGSVMINDFKFGPASITVDVGDSVTWTNQDEVTHTATSSSGGFDTGDIEPGTSGSATFSKAGSFSYICKPHPFMKGTVVVRAASSGGGGGGGDTSSDDSGSSGSSGSTSTPDTTAASPSASEDSGPSLPSTGVDAAALALLGVVLAVLGALVRRRTAAEQPPAGRAGW